MLGQLVEADEGEVELRLLSDADYADYYEAVENELIDQYLEDALSAEEHIQFEQHFLKAPERRDDLAFSAALRQAAQENLSDRQPAMRPVLPKKRDAERHFFTSVYLKAAAVIIVTLGVGLGVWLLVMRGSGEVPGMADLRSAYKNERLVEARVTDLNYAPLATTRGQEKTGIDDASLRRAELQLLKDLDERHDGKVHHALGRFYLAGRQFDKAVEYLGLALEQEPNDAQIHSDLGAALLEEGKSHRSDAEQGKQVEEFALSLDHLNKALQLDDSLLEALFNRALLYQEMKLPQQARDDWKRYLEKDPNSKWADEAKNNLRHLEEQNDGVPESSDRSYRNFINNYSARDEEKAWLDIVQSSCRTGNCIVERLVDEYLDSSAKGQRDEANNKIQMLSYVGELKAQRAGDLYTSSISHFYKSVTPEQAAELREARSLLKAGQAQLAAAQFIPALKSHSDAKRIFDEVGDTPESAAAQYWTAICQQQLNRKDESAALFQQLEQISDREKYEWLRVRSLNGLATHQAMISQYSMAIRYSLRSEVIAGQSLDTYGRISALAFLMQAYLYLGNRSQSMAYAQRLLNADFDSLDLKQRWVSYNETAWALNSLGFYYAAADYQKVALRLALELQDPALTSLSLIRLGAMYGKVGDYDDALEYIQRALKVNDSHSNEPFAQQMIAYASLQLGNVYKQAGRLDEAISSYDSCIDLYNKLNSPTFLYQAHKGKLLSLIAAKNITAADGELDTAISIYEGNRSRIVEESNRDGFFDIEQDIYDVAVDYEYATLGGPAKAFEYSELSRARSLLDSTQAGARVSYESYKPDLILTSTVHPYNLAEIQERMPEQVQIVQYSVLDSRLLIWVVSKHDFQSVSKEIASKRLNERIQEFLRAIISQDQGATSQAARDLFDLLIRPVETFLDKNKHVYIVPDKNLNYVPFRALISPDSGRYLIEDYLLSSTPSSSMFLACTSAAQAKGSAHEERLLSVGDPTFDQREFEGLPDLPSAGEEARKIAGLYSSSLLLTGNRAKKNIVTSEMEKAEVIHLALHSVTDELSPLRSELLLAKDGSDGAPSPASDGILRAAEIYELNLRLAKLVVLSACQTGSGRSYRGEGVMSIARPFLARGVPLVVASLWPVNSSATADLMVSFHALRKREQLPTAEALRQAQLEMLHGENQLYREPYYWASFNIIGGYSEN